MKKNTTIVYKTTNLINGKYYIGVHKVGSMGKQLYLGSGTILKQAIKKYGRKNFIRITLFSFDNYTDAYNKEKELVTQDTLSDDLCYNIKTGGFGGTLENGVEHFNLGNVMSEEAKIKIGIASSSRKSTPESRAKNSKAHKGKNNPRYGMIVTQDTRSKISKAKKGKGCKRCIVKGIEFPSKKQAQQFYQVSPRTIYAWINDPNKPDCYYI